MAIQLPTYERQVRAAPLNAPQAQVVNASNAQGIEALGRGIQQFGTGLAIADRHQDHEAAKADALRVDVVKAQIAQQKQSMLEGKSGFLTTMTGENAIKNSDGYKTQFKSFADTLAKDLSPVQRAQVEPVLISEMTSFGHVIDLHTHQQQTQLREATDKAILTTKANETASAAARGDVAGIDDAFGAALGHFDQMAERDKMPPDIRAAKLQEYTSSARIGVLETLMGTGQAGLAAQYLHEWGASLNQDDLNKSRLRERIDGAVVKGQADDIAASAWARSKSDADQALAAVSKDTTLDPRVRDAALDRVRKLGDQYVEDIKKTDAPKVSSVLERIASGRGGYSLTDLENDQDALALRGQDAKTKLTQAVTAEQRRYSSDAAVRRVARTADEQAVESFKAQMFDDPDTAADIDVTSAHPGVSEKARNEMRGMQQKQRERDQRGADKEKKASQVGFSEFSQMVKARAPKSAEDKRKLYAIAQQWVEDNPGATRADAKKFLDDAIVNVTTEGRVFGTNTMPRYRAQYDHKTIVEPKKDAAPAEKLPDVTAPPNVQQSSTVWMREPPRSDGRPQRMLLVPPDKVKELEAKGAKVVQR